MKPGKTSLPAASIDHGVRRAGQIGADPRNRFALAIDIRAIASVGRDDLAVLDEQRHVQYSNLRFQITDLKSRISDRHGPITAGN